MGSTKEIWLSEGGGVNTASDWGCLKIWGWLWCFCRIWDGMVEANIRVHRWILISRVRDVDAAEARFFVNALSGLFLFLRPETGIS